MEKLKRLPGLNQSEIDTINKVVEILSADIDPKSKDKDIQYKAIQDKVIEKYLSGISTEELVNICKC